MWLKTTENSVGFNVSDVSCKLIMLMTALSSPLTGLSKSCFWNATMNRRSQFTIYIQVSGLDRMNYISTASLNSRWNKEMIKNENYL